MFRAEYNDVDVVEAPVSFRAGGKHHEYNLGRLFGEE